MAFLMQCENKDCREHVEPLLDLKTNQAICSFCGEDIKNVTDFVKNQLKFLGQVKKNSSKKSWAVKCQSCEAQVTPLQKDGKLYCSECDEELKVTQQFASLFLANQRKK